MLSCWRRCLVGVVVAVVGMAAAGCGAGVVGPRRVSLSLVAPTDGATVHVRSIVVFGHVTPADARVLVGGRWAAVRRGAFRLPMRLPLRVDRIGILAVAGGYRPASLMTTVRVSKSGNARPTPAGQPQPGLPGDFAARAEATCSAANQQLAELPPATPQSLAAYLRQAIAMRLSENRQLVTLTGSAASLPAVRTFITDLRAKVGFDRAMLSDLLQGAPRAALQVVRHSIVVAPRFWQDAGRLGVPDCGAVAVSAGSVASAYGQ